MSEADKGLGRLQRQRLKQVKLKKREWQPLWGLGTGLESWEIWGFGVGTS